VCDALTSGGSGEARADGVVSHWNSSGAAGGTRSNSGWINSFGFQDHIRAAREFGFRGFQSWVRLDVAQSKMRIS
jgi:hypothetical protein